MKDSGERKAFEGGGVRDGADKGERFELLWTEKQPYDEQMMTRAARWMARGAEKYADRNWEQFRGPDALEHAKGSLLRHVFKLLAGETDEDHAAASWFNVEAIEYIRWCEREAAKGTASEGGPVDPFAARYFRSGDWYYRCDREGTTRKSGSGRRMASGLLPSELSSTPGVAEVPVSEVPEWAR